MLVGTGFKPPLKGLALAALEWIANSTAPVLAVDLPSGWPADETAAAAQGRYFPPMPSITFTAPKPAHVFGAVDAALGSADRGRADRLAGGGNHFGRST